jgi:hypothetical protein
MELQRNKMKLKEYIDNLNDQVKDNPEILNYDVIYSSDDEGNDFDLVVYTPTIGKFNKDDDGWYQKFDSESSEPNAICIN